MRTGAMQKGYSLDARGTFGYSGGFGRLAFGFNRFGFYDFMCGIYSKKYHYGKPYISKMKFYRPTNPRTISQQNWRAICAYGWVLWYDLESATRLAYAKRAKSKHFTGANLFMSEWLKPATGGFGKIIFSHNAFGI